MCWAITTFSRVFHPDNEPGLFYKGDPVQNHKGMRLGKAVLDIMTDGKLSHVKVPERQDGVIAWNLITTSQYQTHILRPQAGVWML